MPHPPANPSVFKRKIGSQLVTAACDISLEPAVQEVFNSLEELAGSGHKLHAGTRMKFGWSLLELQPHPADPIDSLRVHEPLYLEDPFTQWNFTIDLTLSVIRDQVEWLHRFGLSGSDIYFDHPLVATPDALQAQHLFALREEPATPRDTGWALAPVPAPGGHIDTTSLVSLRVYELLKQRPEILPILTLPTGYLVEFDADQVKEITDGSGHVRWRESSHTTPPAGAR